MTWDSVSTSGFNRPEKVYNDGPNTLVHELFHHLGLGHLFGSASGGDATCDDDDYVSDTPATLGRPVLLVSEGPSPPGEGRCSGGGARWRAHDLHARAHMQCAQKQ